MIRISIKYLIFNSIQNILIVYINLVSSIVVHIENEFLYVILDMLVQCTFRHQIHLLQKKKNVLLHTIEKRFNNSDHHILIFVVPSFMFVWQKELYAVLLLLLLLVVVSPINGVIQLSGRSSIQNVVI